MVVSRDDYWMQQALLLAEEAKAAGEVPIGAIVTLNDEFVASGFNRPISDLDPTAHAEIVAMRAAALKMNNYRLVDTTLYVTLEPCLMCAGAMVHARVKRLVFGAADPKGGALNHHVEVEGGVMADACAEVLKSFFRGKR